MKIWGVYIKTLWEGKVKKHLILASSKDYNFGRKKNVL